VAGGRFLLLGVATGLVFNIGLARADTPPPTPPTPPTSQPAPTVSPPDPVSENGFVTRIQNERATRGIATLVVADDLIDVARHHSADMAARSHIFDDPNMHNEVQNYQQFSDNAGTGPSVDAVHQAFMNSPGHRANLLNPIYSEVGVWVVWKGPALYVTEICREPPVRRPPPPPPPPVARTATVSPPRPAALPAPTTTAPPPTTTPPTTTPPTTVPYLDANIATPWQVPAFISPALPLRRPRNLPTPLVVVSFGLCLGAGIALARITVRPPS